MDHKDLPPVYRMLENQPFPGDQPILFHAVPAPPLNIVVADNQMKPLLPRKRVEQVKDTPVRSAHVCKPPVLPQFIPVPNFDVCKATLVIVTEGVEKQIAVPRKGIGTTAVSTVAVRKKHDAGAVVDRHPHGSFEHLAQPSMRASKGTVSDAAPASGIYRALPSHSFGDHICVRSL